ncbi:hypothetical protein BX600DRAFT_433899 [Xylariales sp. PMI_506]|nr:hypothetical protein BX600DRAFT_433899 [Xylariales sp. PMI_506]
MADNYATQSNAHEIYVPVGIFLVLCPTIVGTRIWSRMRKGGNLGADDFTVVAALMFALASSGIMIASCYYGYGLHFSTLNTYQRIGALKYFYLCQITYKTCINLTKTSILLLYLRIFGGVRWFRWLCMVLALIVAMYCIASVTATIFQCTPVPRAFNKAIPGTCINNGKFWYANAAFSITTDIIILIIPMPLVYALQIPRAQKVALVAVFTLGVFVVITSCLRITTINIQATTNDQTYDIASTMWTIIEMNVAIICACLPQIRPLIAKVFPKLMATYSRDRAAKVPYPSGSGFSGRFRSNPSSTDEGTWAHIEGKDGVNLTNIHKGGTPSEEHILQPEDDDKNLQIQKTVGYSVEYSKDMLRDKISRA